uniref:BZIP domain-containing protein n=1 Tax=Taenia asiatica TaxID=60517 RepID=A0A0R3W0V0_TAEAS
LKFALNVMITVLLFYSLFSYCREAARECRRKKKEYVRCLERQVAILQDQNRQLIEELQKMKALCAADGYQ